LGECAGVARENAAAAGVADRYHTIPGSAFDVEYGDGYDLALVVNFLHHFDPATCEKLLQKVHSSLKQGGRVVLLEFVPNEDRVSPAIPAISASSCLPLRRAEMRTGSKNCSRCLAMPDFAAANCIRFRQPSSM
jgi:SAM-dependent methyltransferase